MAVSLIDLLRQAVSSFGSSPAVREPGGQPLTYADLDEASLRIACRLRSGRGDRVGILVPKSVEAVAGVWAAMRTGAAYVPIDPASPPGRAAYIARDCGLTSILVSSTLGGVVAAVREAVPDIQVLPVHGAPEGAADPAAPLRPPIALAPSPVNAHDLAYVLYTSGSTGAPKGVMVSHGAALGFVDWAMETFALTADDVMSNHAPLHFDLSTFDLFGAAAAGASIVVLDEETVRFPMKAADVLEGERISVWYSVPGALRRMLAAGRLAERDLRRLRLVLFAGEVYPAPELMALQAALPRGVRLCNLYGPTETNVCTWWDVPPQGTWTVDHPPIGVDCSSCQGVIVDDSMHPVADGVPGELLVRGATLMSGYWGDPERTARVFVDDFTYPHLPDRFYRTGDIVSRSANGVYRFHGRRDHMVKIRGYRVELGEVEAALHQMAAVREAAVVAVDRAGSTGGSETDLVAFVVPVSQTDGENSTAVLRRQLATLLPKYMLPAEVRWLPALPPTSSGKVDRQRLMQMAADEADSHDRARSN